MKAYLELAKRIIDEGEIRTDRTGVGTKSIFGTQTRYDLRQGFPLVTSRKINFSAVVKELLWMLRGETNTKTLGCGIWDAWTDKDGDLGRIYSAQWRDWTSQWGEHIDQIERLILGLKDDPMSRRHIVSAWNPGELHSMALPPCHTMFQCYASKIPIYSSFMGDPDPKIFSQNSTRYFYYLNRPEGAPEYFLDLQLYQRSGDFLVGCAFNIASYSLLLMLLAREANMIPRFFIHTIGDAHIYLNHLEGAKEQLSRETRTLPRVEIANKPIPFPGCPRDGSVLEPEDFKLIGYDPHPAIAYKVAI